MKKKLFKAFVELTGHPISSTLLKTFTRSSLSKRINQQFSNVYQLNEQEFEKNITSYNSLHELFTRSLQPGARPIDTNDRQLISPVDGVLSHLGNVNEQRTFHIKNQSYHIETLFGDKKIADTYENGFFALFYLSPRHYHHFHFPMDGKLVRRYALGKVSYPVNDLGLRLGKQPLTSNYRIISELQTEFGKLAIVKVGALNVNSIELYNSSSICKKGIDFGYFSFGSTVMLFLERHEAFQWTATIQDEIQVGVPIGQWK